MLLLFNFVIKNIQLLFVFIAVQDLRRVLVSCEGFRAVCMVKLALKLVYRAVRGALLVQGHAGDVAPLFEEAVIGAQDLLS